MSLNDSQASVDDDAELLLLENLLSNPDEDISGNENDKPVVTKPNKNVPCLIEDHTFAEAFSYEIDLPDSTIRKAAVISKSNIDDVDSSDDEEVKNFLERKYNEYGSDINKKLKQKKAAVHESKVAHEVNNAIKSNTQDNVLLDIHLKNIHNPIKRQAHLSTSFTKTPLPQAKTKEVKSDFAPQNPVFTDPVFGLRMINPLVSSALLVERMSDRKAVNFSNIAFHTQRGDLSKDWVIAGVLVNKSPIRTSKNGSLYSIWRISDLRGEIKMVSLFLFKGAHKDLWKTAQGMCIAVLNPTIFEKRTENNDVACLSIDSSQKVMILGQSKDLGTCKARKRNNEQCTSVVNLSENDYCIFHMKQEFNKMSRRSELQSPNAGRGLNELRNKVLGKSEVFYGGQSYFAVPAKRSAKLISKDMKRMSSLSEYAVSPLASSINHTPKPKNTNVPYANKVGPVSKMAGNIEATSKQRLKDLERLKILQAEAATALTNRTNVLVEEPEKSTIEKAKPETYSSSTKCSINNLSSSKSMSTKVETENGNNSSSPSTSFKKASSIETKDSNTSSISSQNSTASSVAFSSLSKLVPDKFKNSEFSFTSNSLQLSRENFGDIEVNISNRQSELRKQKAISLLKKCPIQKSNPNSTRGSTEGKRRAIDELNDKFCNVAKRQKLEEEQRNQDRKSRIQRIMDATSSHTNLIENRQQQEQEKYFNKLEKKEALEEKMLNTFKMPCKAVICQKCKYTAFSAAERCKEEKHPLKIVDAEKRFFQCKDCGNRTTTVFKLPKTSCSNCKGSHWLRTAMIRERKICDGSEGLSIRGDEECFIGSLAGRTNLNLLVPDE
ncbi:protein MCM10 homolog [Teleopsis dalmanni]|uniref:protein MCM10 homolog n=1 Tax=Teleopsis dalmanni TaxID=139649 RepID=UPI0018CF992E|nr:protein MCM10 homolog [Teleopsis dalmanni]XP_037958557.1 protein MCM10 homolog [Teleopsis dalmanni]